MRVIITPSDKDIVESYALASYLRSVGSVVIIENVTVEQREREMKLSSESIMRAWKRK